MRSFPAQGEEGNRDQVPADDSYVNQVDYPQEPAHSHRDHHRYELADEHATKAAEQHRQVRDERINLERSRVECIQRGEQIENLQSDKGPSRAQDSLESLAPRISHFFGKRFG